MAAVAICSDFGAQEYWSGWHIPSSEELPDLGIKLGSPFLQVDSSPADLPGKPKQFIADVKECLSQD